MNVSIQDARERRLFPAPASGQAKQRVDTRQSPELLGGQIVAD
jgi:hypothetical protein